MMPVKQWLGNLNLPMRKFAWSCLIVCANFFCAKAQADCSRKILVPIAPIGVSVIINGSNVSGVYPDLLRDFSGKTGCQFDFVPVPRARLQAMFDAGEADILIPASKSPQRELSGEFVPLIRVRATLISLGEKHNPIHNMQELLERRELKVGIVRGFDFGSAYQQLVASLTAQGRVSMAVDANDVARMLDAHMVDLTIMAPTILAGALQVDEHTRHMLNQLQYDVIDELAWNDSGVYLSRTRLNEQDRVALKEMFELGVKNGLYWKAFQRYYSSSLLALSLHPR